MSKTIKLVDLNEIIKLTTEQEKSLEQMVKFSRLHGISICTFTWQEGGAVDIAVKEPKDIYKKQKKKDDDEMPF